METVDALSCPVRSCPVLSCPALPCPVLSCPALSSFDGLRHFLASAPSSEQHHVPIIGVPRPAPAPRSASSLFLTLCCLLPCLLSIVCPLAVLAWPVVCSTQAPQHRHDGEYLVISVDCQVCSAHRLIGDTSNALLMPCVPICCLSACFCPSCQPGSL